MKRFIITLAILCVAVGTIVYLQRQKGLPATSPTVAPAPEPTEAARPLMPALAASDGEKGLRAGSADASTAKQASTAPAPKETKSDEPTKPSALTKVMEALVSPEVSFDQKQEMWKQLRDAAQLDQIIEALKQGAASNSTSAGYPTALGEAYLQKAGVASRRGGSINEMGILGMQADQSFDDALKLDPSNWEAQFFKALSMSYWPAELNKGDEVVQRFAALIDQQETTASQPQFARTYILLGQQYEKMGKADYAVATWRLGATKFPTDEMLQKKASGQ